MSRIKNVPLRWLDVRTDAEVPVKLSAPPPPPPEPSETNDSAPSDPKNSVAPLAETATPLPTGSPQNAIEPSRALAAWPAWFGAVDLLLVALTLVLGFLTASFAARNSDFWLHIGVGRMLTTGEYHFGSDPLSYTAVDRVWVNHSWLYDLVCYYLYRGDGSLLVILKAIAVTTSLALLIGIRRSGDSLWPWAIVGVLAAVAAAPRMHLQPTTGTFFFLSATLFVLFRLPTKPGSPILPITIGVIFWFWSNIDSWFVLGPLVLGLLLIGELIRTNLFAPDETSTETGAFGRLHTARSLAMMLIVGIVACMLNPHHFRIWQIPFELLWSDAVTLDPTMQFQSFSPLTGFYWQQENLGFNVNGLAFAALLFLGVFVSSFCVFMGLDPLPIPLAMLWAGFAALSLRSIHAIPFFAVVTVPLVASRLNLLSSRLKLGPRSDLPTRLLLTASVGGRIISVIVVLLLGTAAWPGWLQPPGSAWVSSIVPNPMQLRHVDWKVDPDEALVLAAEKLQNLRTKGDLPTDARGMIASVDLANYCAWYAPSEKVFLNGRYNLHRNEQADFVIIRAALNIFTLVERPPPAEAARIMTAHQASYIGIAARMEESADLRDRFLAVTLQLEMAWQRCSLWYLGGRSALFGWRSSIESSPPTFDALRVDPVNLAFGPGVDRLKPGKVNPIPMARDWVDEFARAPLSLPPEIDEAFAWRKYKELLNVERAQKEQLKNILGSLLLSNVPRVNMQLLPSDNFPILIENDESIRKVAEEHWKMPWADRNAFAATPLLALRAARRAIAANPDHPDAYYILAKVLLDQDLPIPDGDRSVGVVTAYRQCLMRLPPPAQYRRGVYLSSGFDVAYSLGRAYLGARFPNGQFRGLRVDAGFLAEFTDAEIVIQDGSPSGQPSQPPRLMRIPPNPEIRAQMQQSGRLQPGTREIPGRFLQPLDIAAQAFKLAAEYAPIDLEKTEEALRARSFKALETEKKEVDNELRAAFERYRSSLTGQPKLQDRYKAARQFGLIGEAIELLRSPDLSKEFGNETPLILVRKIGLELAVGRLEDAASDIASLGDDLSDLASKIEPARLESYRAPLRHMEYLKCIMEGDYASAGEIQESMQGRVVGQTLPTPAMMLRSEWPVPLVVPVDPITDFSSISFWYIRRLVAFSQARQAISAQMQQTTTFFFRRGLLSLFEGDIAAAKTRFLQCHQPGPPGWDLPPLDHREAIAYVRMIEAAEKKARSK